MRGDAVISPCGTYRYLLQRWWDHKLQNVLFIMLNPSTADGTATDPTLTRCLGFAKDLGFGSLEIVNLFALRATDPAALRLVSDPEGPDNDEYIRGAARVAHMVICAWGTRSPMPYRAPYVLNILKAMSVRPYALRVTKQGHPAHPLYLPGNLQPKFFGHTV